MPRETVPHHPADGQFQVQVGWQRDTDMQLGITVPDTGSGQHHLVDYFYGSVPVCTEVGRLTWEKLHTLVPEAFQPLDFRSSDQEVEFYLSVGRQVLDAVTGAEDGPSTGLWWTPSRFQVNALIRLLRRARDQAMGRDE